jgi:hypothetical protein
MRDANNEIRMEEWKKRRKEMTKKNGKKEGRKEGLELKRND